MTKRILRHASVAGAVAAGTVLLFGGAAQAAPDLISAGNQGIGNGNQVVVPVQAPIDVCGNAVGVLGVSGAGCKGGSKANMNESGLLGDMASAGNSGIANGNQVQAPIQAPIDVCGNAVAVAGASGAGCKGGSNADMGKSHGSESGKTAEGKNGNGLLGDMASAGNNGIGNGNQVQAPIQVPINVCGNAVAVAGVAGAGCKGGSDADMGGSSNGGGNHKASSNNNGSSNMASGAQNTATGSESGKTAEGKNGNGLLGDMVSAGNSGIANGNQVQAPIQVPIDVSGNAVGVLGVAGAGSKGGSSADMG